MTNAPARRVYVPSAIGAEPTTPREALLSAAALLEEEGRWVQGAYYNNSATDTEAYVNDPFCNGWGTCAVGALLTVTLGLFQRPTPDYWLPFDQALGTFPTSPHWFTDEDRYARFVEDCATPAEWETVTPEERLYIDAHKLLDQAARADGVYCGAIGLNDDDTTTRAEVVQMFHDAADCAAESEAVLVDG